MPTTAEGRIERARELIEDTFGGAFMQPLGGLNLLKYEDDESRRWSAEFSSTLKRYYVVIFTKSENGNGQYNINQYKYRAIPESTEVSPPYDR